MGVCGGCGAYTQPRNGKGDAYADTGFRDRRQTRNPSADGTPGIQRNERGNEATLAASAANVVSSEDEERIRRTDRRASSFDHPKTE